MTPADWLAREIVGRVSTAESQATVFPWSTTDQILVIDNHRCLHGRQAAPNEQEERELERMWLTPIR